MLSGLCSLVRSIESLSTESSWGSGAGLVVAGGGGTLAEVNLGWYRRRGGGARSRTMGRYPAPGCTRPDTQPHISTSYTDIYKIFVW